MLQLYRCLIWKKNGQVSNSSRLIRRKSCDDVALWATHLLWAAYYTEQFKNNHQLYRKPFTESWIASTKKTQTCQHTSFSGDSPIFQTHLLLSFLPGISLNSHIPANTPDFKWLANYLSNTKTGKIGINIKLSIFEENYTSERSREDGKISPTLFWFSSVLCE